MNTINQQIESALNQPMFEFKFFRMSDGTRTVVTEYATESNFVSSNPGVIVLSQTN